jgi:hypothetical protein
MDLVHNCHKSADVSKFRITRLFIVLGISFLTLGKISFLVFKYFWLQFKVSGIQKPPLICGDYMHAFFKIWTSNICSLPHTVHLGFLPYYNMVFPSTASPSMSVTNYSFQPLNPVLAKRLYVEQKELNYTIIL